jgi:glycosyltransferase involved in cell wall biosynthesis
MLLQAGARTLVAGAEGPLVAELKAYGGEWVPLANTAANPLARRRNAGTLEHVIAAERVDIVHAQCESAAWSASRALSNLGVWLVTTLPDVPPEAPGQFASAVGMLARGDSIISPSSFAAEPVIQHYGIPRDRVTVIPRSINTAMFDLAAVGPERVEALRRAWQVPEGSQTVVVPGRVAPWNGQQQLPDVARMLADNGYRDVIYVVVGENKTHRRYAKAVLARAREQKVEGMFRFVGHCLDVPAALALATIVGIPATQAPVLGRTVAQAQAMARPVVTTDIGVLPEHIVAPPNMPEDVRTGWLVPAGETMDFARALAFALSLDATAYQAMSARARQFAEYMFAPENVAAATAAVYTALLARET